MARRRRTSLIEDLIEIASRLPWWVSLLIALGSWFILHPIAISQPDAPKDLHQLGQSMTGQLIRTFAFIGQYLLPAVFVIGAIGSVLARAKRKKLAANVANARDPGQTIEGISWREFEQLVGETFRRKGFTVIEKGGNGPDGGVDLVLHLGTDKYLVQCKQWKAINVGVTVIREFFGVMAAEGAAGGFVVTSGRYTAEAKAFAEWRNIQLVDGALLKRWISNRSTATPAAPERRNTDKATDFPSVPLCPVCNENMVIRKAKRGSNIGSEFWGCTKFPVCRGVRKLM
ncbi:restriction endonuclease [Pseudomonas aeruginosa]|uniref:restriction endonuclease n=1 Tax=Gammaproteobacteria TaxID=1236 RepID=UPI00071C043D|nr:MULTISPECIES: restriction endonuclease [Gammaproteobacteria]ELH1141914.1 restriction endonuclease [Pseudomonas aeruginosa]KSF54900.1 restriction endonuclease [Pseudomonas aeruginosa]MCY0373635.1 restriction endonuclease [Pseudomonas aeruginosa]MCY0379312.1 restriction endonuclease [Pseudomonas aeruginosa]MDU7424610.1 restriction endonuclease [Pseudomonas aeruginosa]